MRIDRVTTRAGDGGTTSLAGGRRVPKDHPRIVACGTLDELNAALGVARAFGPRAGRLDSILAEVQQDLFDLGATLATPPDQRRGGYPAESAVPRLEQWIAELNEPLPPLQEFVVPGGGPAAALLHQARTVCRRAERLVVKLGDAGSEAPALRYLNRLSDLLFVAARSANAAGGTPVESWRGPTTPR